MPSSEYGVLKNERLAWQSTPAKPDFPSYSVLFREGEKMLKVANLGRAGHLWNVLNGLFL